MVITTDEQKAAYIAAFIDGEGYIGLCRIKKTGYFTREITFVNTDKILFDAVRQMCLDLGFPVSVYFRSRKLPEHDRWIGRISGGKDIYVRFHALIPLQAPRKKKRLQDIIDSYADPAAITIKRRKGENVTCAHCGKEFYAPPSAKARFCSKKCEGAARITRVVKICLTCGKQFEVIRARAHSRYCSKSCASKARALWWSQIGKRTIADARAAKLLKTK